MHTHYIRNFTLQGDKGASPSLRTTKRFLSPSQQGFWTSAFLLQMVHKSATVTLLLIQNWSVVSPRATVDEWRMSWRMKFFFFFVISRPEYSCWGTALFFLPLQGWFSFCLPRLVHLCFNVSVRECHSENHLKKKRKNDGCWEMRQLRMTSHLLCQHLKGKICPLFRIFQDVFCISAVCDVTKGRAQHLNDTTHWSD